MRQTNAWVGWILVPLMSTLVSSQPQERAGSSSAELAAESLRMNDHYVAAPLRGADRSAWISALETYRENNRPADRKQYERPELDWVARAFTCHFTFMYDRSFYDPESGHYTIDAFLDDGRGEFGGYDAIVLWQGYPRLGVDQRNQFDMYRDMPGGLAGLRGLIRRCHSRGVRVFIDYNPWDRGTRREKTSDEEALAELVAAIDADGIFLDTLSAASPKLRASLDAIRSGVALASEIHPPAAQLSELSASWAQWLKDPAPPGILRLKWLEPRHMQHQIRRWDREHRGEMESAFFNGSGMLVWENVFGTYNPWRPEDRALWRRAVAILRAFQANFVSEAWDPFYPTESQRLFANRWPGTEATVFTLLNRGNPIDGQPLFAFEGSDETLGYDLWNGLPIEIRRTGSSLRVVGSVERLGCVTLIHDRQFAERLQPLLKKHRELPRTELPEKRRNRAEVVVHPHPVHKTPRRPATRGPAGMVLVPAATLTMRIQHQRRECGCYPDPSTPPARRQDFLWGHPHSGTIQHHIGPLEIEPFFIDEAEVTNAEFQRFLAATHYRPSHSENFLKHWPGGVLPPDLADHPVVYVDLEDARAFARWAGKRLPTEAEWHLAAQGTDGRKWPWGPEYDPRRSNTTGDRTLPSRSLPGGRSPYGCFHMAGNVWEWTESVRDDGHTRFAIIRGGSYFRAEESGWYLRGGPQPCDHHAKLLLMWPGLDRSATIGFRCVVDARR